MPDDKTTTMTQSLRAEPAAEPASWRNRRVVRFFGTTRARMLFAFVLTVVLLMLGVSSALLVVSWHHGQAQAFSQLESVAQIKEAEIGAWVDSLHTGLDAVLGGDQVIPSAMVILRNPDRSASDTYWMRSYLQQAIAQTAQFSELFLLDLSGEVVLSTEVTHEGQNFSDQSFFLTGLEGFYAEPPTYSGAVGEALMRVSREIVGSDGEPIGVLAGRVNLNTLSQIMGERGWVGETGETYLVDRRQMPLTALRFQEDYTFKDETAGVKLALTTRADGAQRYDDYRGVLVVGVYRWLPELQMVMIVKQDQSEAFSATDSLLLAIIQLALLGTIAAVAIVLVVTRSIAAPITTLARITEQIASGDLNLTVDIAREDEIGALGHAFNTMTARLRDFVGTLEERVAERTRDTRLAAELGRAIAGVRDLDTLLPYTVDLIRERTGFYHVQIFLLDETEENAVLRASTGEAGQRLLAAGHSLPVGSNSVIGRVTARGEPTIALDTADATIVHRPNPLLPDTRSEIALPLRVEEHVIGALDVQSLEANAFDEDDVEVLQLLANQVAVAIDNARLLQESRARLRQIEQLNRQLVAEAYAEALRLRRAATIGYNAVGKDIYEDNQWSEPMLRAVSEQATVVEAANGARFVALPLVSRGVVVGAVELEIGEDAWAEDTISLASALTARLADSLETTRLFEQAQRLASRERQVNAVTARLQAQVDLDAMVSVAAEEIRRALRARRTAVRVDVE